METIPESLLIKEKSGDLFRILRIDEMSADSQSKRDNGVIRQASMPPYIVRLITFVWMGFFFDTHKTILRPIPFVV